MPCSDSLQAQLETQKIRSVLHLQECVLRTVTSFYDSILFNAHSLGSSLRPGDVQTLGTLLQEAIDRDCEYYRVQLMNALTESLNVKLTWQEVPEKQVELIDLVSDDEEEEEKETGRQTVEQASPTPSTTMSPTVPFRRSKRNSRKVDYRETKEEEEEEPTNKPQNGQQVLVWC